MLSEPRRVPSNSVVLASKARRFRVAVAELEAVWESFHVSQVFRSDSYTMFKSSMHWLASIVLGGYLVGTPRSLLDNSPLRGAAEPGTFAFPASSRGSMKACYMRSR